MFSPVGLYNCFIVTTVLDTILILSKEGLDLEMTPIGDQYVRMTFIFRKKGLNKVWDRFP